MINLADEATSNAVEDSKFNPLIKKRETLISPFEESRNKYFTATSDNFTLILLFPKMPSAELESA